MTKNFKNTAEKIFFYENLYFYLSHGRQTNRRSLQHTKENIQHFQKFNLLTLFLFLWVIFVLLYPDSDPTQGPH
jgi:hypothetical protein